MHVQLGFGACMCVKCDACSVTGSTSMRCTSGDAFMAALWCTFWLVPGYGCARVCLEQNLLPKTFGFCPMNVDTRKRTHANTCMRFTLLIPKRFAKWTCIQNRPFFPSFLLLANVRSPRHKSEPICARQKHGSKLCFSGYVVRVCGIHFSSILRVISCSRWERTRRVRSFKQHKVQSVCGYEVCMYTHTRTRCEHMYIHAPGWDGAE